MGLLQLNEQVFVKKNKTGCFVKNKKSIIENIKKQLKFNLTIDRLSIPTTPFKNLIIVRKKKRTIKKTCINLTIDMRKNKEFIGFCIDKKPLCETKNVFFIKKLQSVADF